MPEETVLQFESEAADTVAYYVKQNVTCQGFFCRKRQVRRESTFSIQVARPDTPTHTSQLIPNTAPRFIITDFIHQQMDLFEISPKNPDTETLSNERHESNPPIPGSGP